MTELADSAPYDLVLAGGSLIDPGAGWHGERADVAFRDGVVADVGPDLSAARARRREDCAGLVVTPGLVDLHAHCYVGGTSCGIDPDALAQRGGVTTIVDAGSAGAGNFAGFRDHVIAPAQTRVLAFLNVSFAGIFALSPTVMVGECEDVRLLDAPSCVAVAGANRDLVVGIKVRVGQQASGASGLAALQVASEAARELDLPLMVHVDLPPPGLDEVLERLKPGDILTHCMRPSPNAATVGDRVRSSVAAARERGVLLDVGHGARSFSFALAESLLAEGLLPDTISSDVHVLSVEGPAHDLLHTTSKLLALGMSLDDVVAATTSRPAAAIGRPDLGTLRRGAPAEAAILSLAEEPFPMRDGTGAERFASRRLRLEGRVLDGRLARRTG